MSTAAGEREPVTISVEERRALTLIDDLLARDQEGHRSPLLVGSGGERIPLPEALVRVLRQVVPALMRDGTVAILPINQELTTQQAADLLNVSRPYLIKLLSAGEIPFIRVGSHRRIRFGDVLEFKRRRDADRRQALATLTRLSREFGLDDE